MHGSIGGMLWELSYGNPVKSFDLGYDGDHFAVGLYNGTVICYELSTATKLWQKLAAPGQIDRLVISKNGEYILTSSVVNGNASLFSVNSGNREWSENILAGDRLEESNEFALSASGEYIFVGTQRAIGQNQLLYYHRNLSSALWVRDINYRVHMVDLDDTGKLGIVGGTAGYLDIVACKYNQLITHFKTDTHNVVKAYLAANGSSAVAYAGKDPGIRTIYGLEIEYHESGSEGILMTEKFWEPLVIPQNYIYYGSFALVGSVVGGILFRRKK